LARDNIHPVDYEWDPEKDRINRLKHNVSFSEASTAFLDPLHITVPDADHSIGEHRFRTIGFTGSSRLVVVAHTDRDDRIRIITAREATSKERRQYEQET
jgi:hypothetical protein